MRQASSFRQPPQNRTSHHQRGRSRQYPYPTPNHSPSAQNAFQCPPRSSWAARASPNIVLDHQPAPPPEPNVLWHRSSTPAPRKLGDTTFRYRDLDPAHQEIRLLRILPDIFDTLINCEVLHTSLNDPRSYIAISYAWGDAEDTRIIVIDGHEFPVTTSLWQALQRLRSVSYAVIVWADAVCINQRNTEERNLQVRSMTRIYSLAYDVAIWLGPEDDDSDLAVDLLHEISACSGPQVNAIRLRDIIKAENLKSEFRALVCLFERDYWTRLWVVQEVVNAKRISVYCGSRSVPWDTFLTSSYLLRQYHLDLVKYFPVTAAVREDTLSTDGQSLPDVLAYEGPGRLWCGESKDGLLQALCHHRNKSCADPRDKVYGVFGILSEQERSHFLIDYAMSKRDVYINVVAYLLTTTRKLDTICHAIHFPPHQSTERVPSWVPDWSHKPVRRAMAYNFPGFSAAKNSDARFTFAERGKKLAFAGIQIDPISNSAPHLSPPVGISTLLMTIFQWRLVLMGHADCDNIAAHEAFCLALGLGHLDDGVTTRQWMERVYHVLATSLKHYYPPFELDHQLAALAKNPNQISDENRDVTLHQLLANLEGRRFFISQSGTICLGSGAGHVRDIICVPLGCSTPIILRKRRGGYEYVGDIYVDGYMYGKAIDELNSGERKLERFCLQ